MSIEHEILEIFKDTNTYLEHGHFRLVSGKHSDTYIQVRVALSVDKVAKKVAKIMADQFKGRKIDKVIGFTVGGNILATKVAFCL